jgi:hypothetical protein
LKIPSSNVARAFRKYRNEQGFLSGGFGRKLLTFMRTGSKVKKALKGGVHFRLSRLNLISSANQSVTPDTKLKDVMASFSLVFLSLVNEIKQYAKPEDKIQFVVYTEKTPGFEGDTGMRNPVTTPFIELKALDQKTIVPFIVANFHRYDHIVIGDQIIIESVIIRKGQMSQTEIESFEAGKHDWISVLDRVERIRGVIRITNSDDMCLARAVVVALFHEEMLLKSNSSEFGVRKAMFESVRVGSDRHWAQSDYAILLCLFSNVEPFRMTSDQDIEKIARFLKAQIKIVSSENYGISRIFGDPSSSLILYILERFVRVNDDIMSPDCIEKVCLHFDAITDIRIFKGTKYFCKFCDIGFNYIQSHKCRDLEASWCFACFQRTCIANRQIRDDDAERCLKCRVIVQNNQCLEVHKTLDICRFYFCRRCNRRIVKKRKAGDVFETFNEIKARHECEIKCAICGRMKTKGVHKCFMLRTPFKQPCSRFLFLDFETDQSSGVHYPICCFVKWVEFSTDKDKEGEIINSGEKYFGVHYLVAYEVGKFLFHKRFWGYTIIAHNMKGFDGCFLLRYLIQNNFEIDVIANGLKLNAISVSRFNIRIIDSLNFFQMSLAALVSAMGIEATVKTKGFFPHFFTCPENLTYEGPVPDLEYYGCFDMKSKQYSELVAWHTEQRTLNKIFRFLDAVKEYCMQDVIILFEGCLRFRSTLMKEVQNIPPQPDVLDDEAAVEAERALKRTNNDFDLAIEDPFEGMIEDPKKDEFDNEGVCDPFSMTTAPGVCASIFKAKFLKKNSIGLIPPAGYSNFRHSQTGLEYCEYLRKTEFPDLLHAQNTIDGKEVVLLNRYRVDGFSPSTNTIVEFNGCFWHGCPTCIRDMSMLNPVRKISYEALNAATKQREKELTSKGYSMHIMWECEWNRKKRDDAEVREIVSNIHVKSRLSPREAFRGGRTEAAKLFWDINESEHKLGLAYVDICSLYPTVNKNEFYPVGHPQIITSDFDISALDSYFGLIQCSVLAPRNLLNGILPYHANGKLMFPLCRTCVEQLQIDVCRHSENERILYGVWVSEELKQAVKYGYEIKQIYCLHQFPRKSKELFDGYIKTFFKMKLGASKRPENETPEQLQKFINDVRDREGIEMKPEDFSNNPGLRSIAKLCCNSFWGRLGMRDSFPRVVFVRSHEKLMKLFEDPHWDVTSVRYVTANCIAVLLSSKSVDSLTITNNTNIYAAVFTTAYARMRLFELLHKVGARLIYCDTDSVIYELSPNAWENLPLGSFMGDLTNELGEGEVIIRFVSGGPKVYAYLTNKGNCVVKIKGFQLSQRTQAAFSFENLERIIKTYVEEHLDNDIGRVRPDSKQAQKRKHEQIRQDIFKEFHYDQEHIGGAGANKYALSVYNTNRILRTRSFELLKGVEQKLYTFNFNKRIVLNDFSAVPYGYVKDE